MSGQNKENLEFYQRVYRIVRRIPPGKVLTYGQVAALAGKPRRSRAVGWAMRTCDLEEHPVPWHRVLNAQGKSSLGEAEGEESRQIRLLRSEGVVFDSTGRCDLEIYQWNPPRDTQSERLPEEECWELPPPARAFPFGDR